MRLNTVVSQKNNWMWKYSEQILTMPESSMPTLNSLPKCFRLTRHYIVRKRPVYHESTQSHSNVYPIFLRCSVWELSKLIPSAWLSIMMGSDGMPVFIENRFGGGLSIFFMMVKESLQMFPRMFNLLIFTKVQNKAMRQELLPGGTAESLAGLILEIGQ